MHYVSVAVIGTWNAAARFAICALLSPPSVSPSANPGNAALGPVRWSRRRSGLTVALLGKRWAFVRTRAERHPRNRAVLSQHVAALTTRRSTLPIELRSCLV